MESKPSRHARATIQELQDKVSLLQQAEAASQAKSSFLHTIASKLRRTLNNVLDMTQLLLSNICLSYQEEKAMLETILNFSNDMSTLVNEIQDYASLDSNQLSIDIKSVNLNVNAPMSMSETENTLACLRSVKILLADDNCNRTDILAKQLHAQNAQLVSLPSDEALTALRKGLKSDRPFQIVIISQQDFNPHAAYVARTIRAIPALHDVMLVLAIMNELADYELDQALFSGYTCVTHALHPELFIHKLAQSWQCWSVSGPAIKHQALALPKLLVVEDNTLSQKVARLMLEALGCQVDIANNGFTALQLLEKSAYSLILMDIGLPDISGLEVTSKFRQRERDSGNHTPIVALTAHSLEQTANAIQSCGMNGYLAKPLLQEKLRTMLNQWVFNAVHPRLAT